MIIVNIKGGLGNQFFQYAFARYLSLKTERKLKFDISYYKKNDYRTFDLNKFNISFDGFISLKESLILRGAKRFPKFFKNICILKDTSEYFDSKIFEKILNKKICYLDGYWQSETYFNQINDLIKEELKLKQTYLKKLDNKIIQKILNTNSVSVHVRRGDHVTIPANKPYIVCKEKYYQDALKIIQQKVVNPYYFIFSDDIAWVKNNLFKSFPCFYIDQTDVFEDFQLMSLCKHNVMANSTFSWWAARLNKNPQKIVVAPYAWRTDGVREELYTNYQIRI